MFVCMHGHFRFDPRITPIVIRHALNGFEINAAEPNLRMDGVAAPILTGPQGKMYELYLKSVAAAEGKQNHRFVMILQINGKTTPVIVRQAYMMGYRVFKYYSEGTTTNSETGVKGWWEPIWPALLEIAQINREHPEAPIILQVHVEALHDELGNTLNPWEREEAAIPKAEELVTRLPDLLISFEHASTYAAVELAIRCKNIFLSISVVHLTCTKDDVLQNGRLCTHKWCAPVAKDEKSRLRLVEAALGFIPELVGRVYLGLDFAPHDVMLKEAQTAWPYPPPKDGKLPPMGAYSLDVAIPLLLALFRRYGGQNWQTRLQAFASTNGPDCYHIPRPTHFMRVLRSPHRVPNYYTDTNGVPVLKSFLAGEVLDYQVVAVNL